MSSHARTRLCNIDDVPDGGALQVALPDRPPLAVFRLDGRCFVTDDTCTHGNASLCDGDVEDGLVICPFHAGSFDIRTGAAVDRPCVKDLRTYEAMEDGGILYAVLPEA